MYFFDLSGMEMDQFTVTLITEPCGEKSLGRTNKLEGQLANWKFQSKRYPQK